ncbi:MAG: glutathione S-transferase C-terminal domain-containing protein [Pseudomonadales bacterium]|jgi:glutathione S-transferase|nr:glutathione S-transferase C-terminal domain-containing protein [Pseudomonadales bacterium]MDP6472570.1 glutathione S-transferase C-terminal domain-containing protein [Pseudomonadales bacterium]MDP6829052.1 glutathione S-transferase C-terminal domain-containing protein [Pseudomonadales bacterium]MDP6971679.1 glutathione S-transferase C-terminal domain-containing protein [Pseudomonadales bacterium]|tara:strand:- start:2806 stop:3834 length:1029 start_codon:yes stop_codon:yes gene_type:complete
MSQNEPLKLKGVPGSPYTRKMLAYMRFRHIPYELLIGDQSAALGLPEAKVSLLPTFYLPNADGELEAVVDSTPLIRRFEAEFSGRAALPVDPVLNFLNYLIEDYADEWLTKAMFHYRWYYDADIEMAGTVLPHWSNIQAPAQELSNLKGYVAERQISRLYVVGSNDTTAPVIEASYKRFLGLMNALIEKQKFVLGTRPSSADFGLYAQLTQLAKFDPTPAGICLDLAPRVFAWIDLVDDLSGQPAPGNAWMSAQDAPAVLGDLLHEIGRTYAQALLANAEALQAGREHMETTIDGQLWQQPVFPYQAKCLQWINAEYRQLDTVAKAQVDEILAGTGCDTIVF